jgi:hypothetical protein
MIIYGSTQVRFIGVLYTLGPVIMAIAGFVLFVVFAAIHNYLAKWLGGFEFELEETEPAIRTSEPGIFRAGELAPTHCRVATLRGDGESGSNRTMGMW